jgi:hypothetical protein
MKGNDGDKIVIARDESSQHWIYFSVSDTNDHGTIIDFLNYRKNKPWRYPKRITPVAWDNINVKLTATTASKPLSKERHSHQARPCRSAGTICGGNAAYWEPQLP